MEFCYAELVGKTNDFKTDYYVQKTVLEWKFVSWYDRHHCTCEQIECITDFHVNIQCKYEFHAKCIRSLE